MDSKKTKQIHLYVSDDYHQQLKRSAEKLGYSIGELVKRSLNDYLKLDKYVKLLSFNKITQNQSNKNKVNFFLRITPKEKEALIDNAKSCGLNVSSYIRLRCIYDVDLLPINNAALKENQYNLLKIGNNINQIAKTLNTYKGREKTAFAIVQENLSSTLDELQKLIDLQRIMLKGYITKEEREMLDAEDIQVPNEQTINSFEE